MNYEQAMQYIHSVMRFGSKLGLERMRELMHRLGNPQKKLKFIHVAGTNGKGSTVTMLSEILQESGYRVGKYVSPYVYDFRERIAVDGMMISKDALCKLTERISFCCAQMESDGWDSVTEFELVTAIAFCYYYEQKCDVVVLEVGLGGRFDATNIIDAPLVSVITALSLDHTSILGDTIEQITFEKAGIIKQGSVTVMYPRQPAGAYDQVQSICKDRHVDLIVPDVFQLEIEQSNLEGNVFSYEGLALVQRLMGEYQIYNAITVIETVKALRLKGFDITDEAVGRGIKKCRMPARFEKLSDQPLIIMDAGHNPQGIDALAALLDQLGDRKKRVVFAVMRDKEYAYAIDLLSKRADSFYGVSLAMERALKAEEITAIARKNCSKTKTFDSVESALAEAIFDLGDDCLLICGSFYVMESALSFLKKQGIC